MTVGCAVGKEDEDDQLVRYVVVDRVATITLASPLNRNALSHRLLADLNAALERAERADVRAIVLTHVGAVFCAGADLKERLAGRPPDSSLMTCAIQRLSTMAAPSIAAVKGAARAGGIGLMAACDLVVVDRSVTFAFTEVRVGVAPAIISVPILARCGWSALAAPFMTGEAFDATVAREMGLVTHVSDDVDATVATLVTGVLHAAPSAVAATKKILRERSAVMSDMQELSDSLFDSAEAREGMNAFLAGRQPSWAPKLA